ncbi:hypothetical protein [Aporhodopirellula aestuarii]|uniref:Uncharacterized protein n=1 Tax=Aporhodopirellula aestuarii TaxID=2950107 RepID=A0ABT0UD76_9BACT|nr:hypothetical protein [Aporhodopirellula aestuarii]MCM2374694.1 hypothetical protein [Aporhodopirellula aestuarii]
MSIDLTKYLEITRFEYDPERLQILDDELMFVAELGRPSLILPNDSLIHAQGRLMAAAPELRRRLASLQILYEKECPANRRKKFVLDHTWEFIDGILDESLKNAADPDTARTA